MSPASTPSVRVGLVNGCFDRFHEGHARFLWAAKKLCDYLIVGVNDDESVRRLKGPDRPFELLKARMDRVAKYADLTAPFNGDVAALISEMRPHRIIRGWDQQVEDHDFTGDLIKLPRYGTTSTTGIAYG